MPYEWTRDKDGADELALWPHRSMTRKGFVFFMGATLVLWSIPLLSVLGTAALWWMLPFVLLTVLLLWILIQRNYRDAELSEVLHIDGTETSLHRENPRGPAQDWSCNTHWVSVHMREDNRRLPHYVTLKGAGREVEIGAFLSEDERLELYDELAERLAAAKGSA
ncbi:MAG: DUF2244 domain-containing protein [Pseudomonadota bacterium]